MGRKTMRMKMTKRGKSMRGKMTKRRRKTRGGKNTPKPDSFEKRRLELLKGYRNDAQQKINNRENNFGFIKTQTIGHDNASINVDKLVLKRIFGHNNKSHNNKSIDLEKLSTGSYGFPAEANQRSLKSAEKSSLLKKSSSLKKLKTTPSKNTSSERKRKEAKEAKELEAFLKAKQASQKRGEKRVVLDY